MYKLITFTALAVALAACEPTVTAPVTSGEVTPEMELLKNQVLVCTVALVATGEIVMVGSDDPEHKDRIEYKSILETGYEVTLNGQEATAADYAKIDQCVDEEAGTS